MAAATSGISNSTTCLLLQQDPQHHPDIIVDPSAAAVAPPPHNNHNDNNNDRLCPSHSHSSSSTSSTTLQQRRRLQLLPLADNTNTTTAPSRTVSMGDNGGGATRDDEEADKTRPKTKRRPRRRHSQKRSSRNNDDRWGLGWCRVVRVATTLALIVWVGRITYTRVVSTTPAVPAADDDFVDPAEPVVVPRKIIPPTPKTINNNNNSNNKNGAVVSTTRTPPAQLSVRQQQQQQHEEEEEEDPKSAILGIQKKRNSEDDSDDHPSQAQNHPRQEHWAAAELKRRIPPSWNLTNRARLWDAYALAEQRQQKRQKQSSQSAQSNALFWQTAAELRLRFAATYGGELVARALVEQSLTTTTTNVSSRPDDDVLQTACRIRRARRAARPFRMAFAGYSVTAGRGNYHNQSYPLVLQELLRPAFEHLFGLGVQSLQIRNAAIGGCPSFPYGWCLRNFLGGTTNNDTVVDVVSWDFRMNEAGGNPVGLEAYVRHVASSPFGSSPPKLIVLDDTHQATARQSVLQQYAASTTPSLWFLRDAIVLHTDRAVRPFLELPLEEDRPVGFRNWRQFGAPPRAPGQSAHHPAVPEHAFMAWILALHFLNALELVAAADESENEDSSSSSAQWKHDLEEYCREYDRHALRESSAMLLPKPIYQGFNYSEPWTSILFGEPVSTTNPNDASSSLPWKMNAVHCRTTFDPIVYGNLSDIVVAGSTAEDLDVMLPKSKQFYNRHFVLDMSDAEKKAKRNLNRYDGGLGFVDSKKAYYGIYASGTLTLWLPYEASAAAVTTTTTMTTRSRTVRRRIDDSQQQYDQHHSALPQPDDPATAWYKSVVVCQVNEQQQQTQSQSTAAACETWRDVQFAMNGVPVVTMTALDAPGTVYLGRKLCAHLVVPPTARLTQRPSAVVVDAEPAKQQQQQPQVGLLLTATVNNPHIVQRNQACSISHVVWEQREREPGT